MRTFGALLSHDGVCLVEYRAERAGIRVMEQWTDATRCATIDEALARLVAIVSALHVKKARIAAAVEQFGVFHHVMTLPHADDDVLRPVIAREVQRVFGLTDPVFAFTRDDSPAPARADGRAAPRQVFIGGAPKDVVDSFAGPLASGRVEIELVTVVAKAMHSLYRASGATHEPTAVLSCLEGGPHLAFFLDGRLELAIDPPIALEGDRGPIPVILDQFERGAVYFRQQFRGATATRLLLAAPAGDYDTLAAALEQRLSIRVSPLFSGSVTPAAVVAMGAVLEARHAAPLDLLPHPPTLTDRVRVALEGPNALVAGMATAAAVAGIWSATQFASLSSLRRERDALRADLRASVPAVEPMRKIAETRADYARRVQFVGASRDERASLTSTMQSIAHETPGGVRFDSLRIVRAASGWTVAVAGAASGTTAAQSVRALDGFYQAVRSRPGVTSASLDQFDYTPAADSTKRAGAPVVADFHVSFSLSRGSTR
ncbi:MAG: hypothetical protein ACREPM_20430 [Gemmatimonadaceae bacterium]